MDNIHLPSPIFGIIADDLTSAADGGVSFVKKGLSVEVSSTIDMDQSLRESNVISVNCSSRSMTAQRAAKTVHHVTRAVSKPLIPR